MSLKQSQNEPIDISLEYDDFLDLNSLIAVLWRGRRIITSFAFISLVFSIIYAYTAKPTWQGQFQIVLDEKKIYGKGVSEKGQLAMGDFLGTGSSKSVLKTQVKILESPSVLKPVFDFVKEENSKLGINLSDLRFRDWKRKQLLINLEKGTSVLNLTYYDKEKELIKPVIQKISKAYQEYSGRDRIRSINKGINYLKSQIKIYKVKSLESLRKTQEFAIANDLSVLTGEIETDTQGDSISSIDIEAIRVDSSNKIRSIKEQISQIENLDEDIEKIIYVGQNIKGLSGLSSFNKLRKLEDRIATLKFNYKDSDISIQNLENQRQDLLKLAMKQSYGYLEGQLLIQKARLASAKRPKGIIISFKELLRNTARDEATLLKLEDELQLISLEKAKDEDPWQLISSPTVLDKPVSPIKRRLAAFGLLLGSTVGSLIAYIKEKKEGKIYDLLEFKTLIPYPIIFDFSCVDSLKTLKSSSEIINEYFLQKNNDKNGGILLLNSAKDDKAFNFIKNIKSDKIIASSNIEDLVNCGKILILCYSGVCKRNYLNLLLQRIKVKNITIDGWIFI